MCSAALGRDLRGHALRLAQGARDHQHPAANGAEPARDAAANAAARTRNDDAATFDGCEHGGASMVI